MAMIQPLDIFCVRTYGLAGAVIRTALSSRRKRRFVWTNHNAPVWVDDNGNLFVTQIEPWRNKTYSISEYFELLKRERADWFVCRPAILDHVAEYDPTIIDTLQPKAAEFWKSIEGHKYPLRDLWVLYRNLVLWPLKRIGLIKPDLAHVYCTEGVKEGFKKIHISLMCIGNEDFPHPGHIENGCRTKELIFVAGSASLFSKVIGTA